jgi:hypothetical protein
LSDGRHEEAPSALDLDGEACAVANNPHVGAKPSPSSAR